MEERAKNYGVEVDGLQVVGQQSALHSHHVPPKKNKFIVPLPTLYGTYLSTSISFNIVFDPYWLQHYGSGYREPDLDQTVPSHLRLNFYISTFS